MLLSASLLAAAFAAPTPARELYTVEPSDTITVSVQAVDERQTGTAQVGLPELMEWAEWKAAFGRQYGAAEEERRAAIFAETVRLLPGRLSALSVSHSKSVLYGAFVWVCRALNSPKRRFPARAGGGHHGPQQRHPCVQAWRRAADSAGPGGPPGPLGLVIA
jgi:hypothetical protein